MAQRLDTKAYPDLTPLMARRQRQVHLVQMRRELDPEHADGILEFWQELAERIDCQEEIGHMEAIVSEIRNDIDMLRSLKLTLEIKKESEPEAGHQLVKLIQMIRLMLDLLDTYKKRLWMLRDQALAYWMSLNPAFPSKLAAQKDKDKDKRKEGQAKSKAAIEQTRQRGGKGKAKDKKKKAGVREKKMEA